MKSINEILNQNQDNKSKADLVKLLSNLSDLITIDEYQKVSGVDPKTELEKLTKKEIIAVLDDFRENYNAQWEANIANASSEVIREIFGMMEADEARFGAMAASDADFAAELGSIDFEKLIGGPMQAAVSAQNSASLSTVAFIKEVGFEGNAPNQKIRMVDFSYSKNTANPNLGKTIGTGPGEVPAGTDVTSATIVENVVINVPFISILNVPSLRIETLDIDLNVKLNSVYTTNTSSTFRMGASASGGFWGVKFKVSSSYRRTSSTGVKVEKEYSMNVKVKATNDEMPAGLEKVLGMMSA